VDEIAGRYDTGHLDLDAFARAVSPHIGMPPEDVVRLQACYLLGVYPGVTELLDEIARAGVRTACLSNTSDQHWRMMNDPASPAHLPLDRLDYRFASHLLRLRKPDEAIYAHVERVTETPGDRIVFFDDIPANVEAARRRGWHAYRIDPAPDDPLPQVRRHLAHHRVGTGGNL
jgi:putative hydrolase of the HAD superfamily